MSPRFPRERSSPFTRATISRRRSPSSSGVTSTGPSEVAKSLPFAGPRPTFISWRCRSRADQSFMTVKPPICAVGADHRGHLELVVQRLGALRVRDLVVGPVDRGRVREVEDRDLVPLRHDLAAAGDRARVADVLLEGVEVAHRRRPLHRREQPHLVERVLGVLARVAAAGEERLERLRGELDHAVALDPPRPAADSCSSGVNMQRRGQSRTCYPAKPRPQSGSAPCARSRR